MSLFGSIQLANNTLRASQIGLQVVGQNIANANTPGYIREEVILAPATTQRQGGLLLGLGVRIEAVVQEIDTFLEARLRGAVSDRASAEAQERTYLDLEGLIGELSDTDLSTSLNSFFNSISEVLNQPENAAVRNLAVLQGRTLATDVRRLFGRALELHEDVNNRVTDLSRDINRLTSEIRELNVRIASAESGGATPSDAVGLRDQRLLALTQLAELTNINAIEQPDSTVSIFVDGDFLVLGNERREVTVADVSDNGRIRSEIRIAATDSPLSAEGGALAGLTESRDVILDGFLDGLDDFARTLSFEFNQIFSSGQGLSGYEELVSEFAVDASDATLDAANLPFTPENGSFEVLVYNTQTELSQTSTIRVDLNGLDEDSTLADVVAQLEAVDGISAQITPTGRLSIESDAVDSTFAFANDSSGLLASLGINTFFSGTGAADIDVSQAIQDDSSKFAASRNGIGEDTLIAIDLAAFLDRPLDSVGGENLAEQYDTLINTTVQGSTVTRSVAEGLRVFESSLESEKLATSGVNLDEEAVRLIAFQRTYQASARYIATISDLLDVLVNL